MNKFKLIVVLLLAIIVATGCKKEDDPISEPDGPSNAEFKKKFGGGQDDRIDVMMELNGSLYMFGTSKSFDDINGDLYLLKLNFFGEVEFEKTFGGNMAEEGVSMVVSDDGNILLSGTTESFGFGGKDIYVLKVSPAGVVIWEQTFGGDLDDKAGEIIVKNSGEYVVVGSTESFGSGERDIYVARINSNGSLLAQYHFGNENYYSGTKVLTEQGNNLLIYGWTQDEVTANRLIYMMRINFQGDSIWSKTYGDGTYQESQDIIKTEDGGYLINGHTNATDPNHNMFILKLDASLNEVWQDEYGGARHDGGESVTINSEGNYMFTATSSSFGQNNSDVYYLITNPQGDSLTAEAFIDHGNQWGKDFVEFGDHYYFGGYTDSLTLGGTDVYLIKILKEE